MKITRKYYLLTLFCFVALILSACNNIVQAPLLINQASPTDGSQAMGLTPVYDDPSGTTPQAFDSTVTYPTDATPTLPPTPTAVPTAVPTLPDSVAASFTETDLKNAIYTIKDFAAENGGSDTVKLVDGYYAYVDPTNPPAPSNYTVQYQTSAIGDLNGDGMPDAAVILIADTSGSGTFIYLAAMVSGGGRLENSDTIYLGDRVIVESMAIQDGMIHLQMITHGPQDAMCCPSLKTNQTYLLDSGHLVPQADIIAAPLADEIIEALKAEDMAKLSQFVDPSAGVRFSPYTNIKDTHLVFTRSQFANAFSDSTVYTWGNYEGSGAPIQLTFSGYYERFVYNRDFASATAIGYNHPLSNATVLDNSTTFYPNSIIVEYYLPDANQDYDAGLDWQSLKLVFEQMSPVGSNPAGQWYLVGIIHSQWTI